MNFKRRFFYRGLLAIIIIVVFLFLLSGSGWLTLRVKILFGFHFGTVMAWLGLIASSLLAISINAKNPKFGFLSSLSFYIAIFWLLISFLLAGNNNLVFTGNRRPAFYFWLSISAFPFGILLISLFFILIQAVFKSSGRS